MNEDSNPGWGVSIGGVDFSKFVREVDIDWDVTKMDLSKLVREPTCGAFPEYGGCDLPAGHNLGRASVPGNHRFPPDDPEDDLDLSVWWMNQSEQDIDRTVPKIEEYGTRDLEAMGHALATARGTTFTPAQAAIYGCMFYALGKTMRAVASLERGDTPSGDTLFDLSVYAMMARSYQDRGKL